MSNLLVNRKVSVMPASLKEFLSGQGKTSLPRPDLEGWLKSLNRLFDEMETWLRASDETKVLTIDRTSVTLREEGLPDYQAPSLRITLGRDFVDITTKALNTLRFVPETPGVIHLARSAGVVEMSNGYRKAYLYRKSATEDDWVIVDHERHQLQPFKKETFEEKLLDLLS
jgi:hypothetical protein